MISGSLLRSFNPEEEREERNMPGTCKDNIRDCQRFRAGVGGDDCGEKDDLVTAPTMLIKLADEISQAGRGVLGQMR